MEKFDKARPEPVLFLLEARDAMTSYKRLHHTYATEWNMLEIEFSGKPYRVGDAGTKPAKTDKATWKPLNCEYTYRIINADSNIYLIHALDANNKPVYEMTDKMKSPKNLKL